MDLGVRQTERGIRTICALSVAAALLLCAAGVSAQTSGARSLLYGFVRTDTYQSYVSRYPDASRPGRAVSVSGGDFSSESGTDIQVLSDFEGERDVIRWTNDLADD